MRKLMLALLAVLCFSIQLLAQNRTVTGKVTDEAGNPIPSASVQVKGTSNGTTTGSDGSFSLSVPVNTKSLVISSVNYTTQEVAVGKSTTFVNPQLKAATGNLSEVVVVGYGTQKRATLTSAQSKVGGEKLENVPFSSVDQILQGKVAGLQSITSTGQPGANQQVRIRGIGSITASAQPLYVVDGVQINSGDLSRLNTTSNTLAGLNPDDIERVDVLKDASATAIYGSRGSNGVILITTKKGKAGKTQIQFSAEVGQNKLGTAPANARPLGATDFLALAKEGLVNAGYSAATVTATLHQYGDTSNIDTKWYDLVTRRGAQQQYNLSASGGTDKSTFFASIGYFNQQATVIGSDLKRYSGRINLTNKVSDKLLFEFGLNGAYTYANVPLGTSNFSNPIMDIYFLRPTQNPYNADGSLNISRVGVTNFQGGVTHNPLYTMSHNIYNTRTTQAKPNAYVEYTIINGLKASTRIGVDYNNIEEFQYWNPANGDGVTYNGYGFAYYTRYFLYDWTNQLSYHKNFLNNDLSTDIKVGYESISNNQYVMTSSANTYSTDKLVDLANASNYVSATTSGSDYRFASAFTNGVFTYKNKYTLSGSFRRDGSSRFGPTQKYGNFYSVGGSWNVSEENFFKPITFVSMLKLRGSYGISGNAEIGNYTATQLQSSGYNYNGLAGTAFETVGNESLGWEKSKQTDIGIEIGLLKDRINIVADWYNKINDGLLYAAPISQTTGFTSKTANIGALQNKGFEVTINASPVKTKDFTWDISANFTHNVNKITNLPNNNADIISGLFRLRTGEDYRNIYTYEWAGVDPANGDPLWWTDSTHKATTNDYTKATKVNTGKSASPKYYGGLSNTFTYKNFSITADFTYNFGNYVYDQWATYFMDGQYALTYGKYARNLNRWTTPGQVTNVPKYVYGSTNKSSSTSTRWLYNGDYIRLRNLEVAFNAPKTLVNRVGINSFRFYVRGSNLYTWIKDKDIPFDPEQGVNGLADLNVFLNRSVTVGLVLGL